MKKIRILFLATFITLTLLSSCTQKKTDKVENKEDAKIKELLGKMSLEEKAGQMTQIDIRNLLNDGYNNSDQKLNKDKLKEAIHTWHVGSLLNCIHAYTPVKWNQLITEIQGECMNTKNKIPVIYGTDAVHGASFIDGATLFPHNIGLAATRNNALVKNAAEITALEARSVGFTWNFSPVLDVGREPYWSRLEETFGEDVYLTTQMGAVSIEGMEGSNLNDKNTIASCMKHFLGYSAPKNGIDRTPAHIPEIVLREYYLPPFTEAVKRGASTIMINSGEINGIPTHGNKWLLTDVLRNELKFEGLVCSDWEDIIRLHTLHHVAATPKEAVAMGVNAGIDMSMVPNDYSFPKYVVELVNEGKISMERIDEAVTRILRLKNKLGLLENPLPDLKDLQNFGKDSYQTVALEAARESITLLKNNKDLLPLSREKKILLAGPCANSLTALSSSWSYTWQGDVESFYPGTAKTIQAALKDFIAEKQVFTQASGTFEAPVNYDISFIEKNSNKCDVIVLCLGEKAYAEQPGVIKDLNLPEEQKVLVRAAKKTGKPVVVILVEGRPRLFPEEAELTDAVLMCYRPGTAGGTAIAEVLLGEVNPSGVLPFTYPKYNGDIMTYDHKFKETEQQLSAGKSDMLAFNPQWEFGHGLSYTSFEFSNLKTDKIKFGKKDSVKVSVDIMNSGKRSGKVAVELYSRDHYASITPSQKRLRKYSKITLEPGEKKTVDFYIYPSDLEFVTSALQRITEPGKFDLIVKNLITEIEYTE